MENSDALGAVTNALDLLNIGAGTSRSQAHKNKEATNQHLCAVCFKMFESHNQLGEHLRDKHKASAKELTDDYKKEKAALTADPDNLIHQHNFKIALAKVICLEKYSKTKP